jgi:hypothetical protein
VEAESVGRKLILASILLLFFSCDKEPEPTPPPCRLVKTIIGSLSYEVEYDADGLPTKVTASDTNNAQEFVVDLEYQDGRLLKINNAANSFDEFFYEGDRLKEIRAMRKYETSQTFTLDFTTTFEYNPEGQIVKAVFTGPGLPANGELYERAVYIAGNAVVIFTTNNGTPNEYGPERKRTEVLRFDINSNTHTNFPFNVNFRLQNGLQGFNLSYNHFQNRNNPLELRNYPMGGVPSDYVVTLEYNEQGYPTKSTSRGTAEFEYECDDVQ